MTLTLVLASLSLALYILLNLLFSSFLGSRRMSCAYVMGVALARNSWCWHLETTVSLNSTISTSRPYPCALDISFLACLHSGGIDGWHQRSFLFFLVEYLPCTLLRHQAAHSTYKAPLYVPHIRTLAHFLLIQRYLGHHTT